jgi:hypothetical protein
MSAGLSTTLIMYSHIVTFLKFCQLFVSCCTGMGGSLESCPQSFFFDNSVTFKNCVGLVARYFITTPSDIPVRTIVRTSVSALYRVTSI